MSVDRDDIKLYLPEEWTGVPHEDLEEAYAEFSRVFPHGECSSVIHYWRIGNHWFKRQGEQTWRLEKGEDGESQEWVEYG